MFSSVKKIGFMLFLALFTHIFPSLSFAQQDVMNVVSSSKDTLLKVSEQGIVIPLGISPGRVSSSSFSILGGAGRSESAIFSVNSDATLRLSNGNAFFDNSSMTVSLGGSTPRVSSSSFSILGGAGRSMGDTLFNVNTSGVTVSLPGSGRVSSSSFSILGGAGRSIDPLFSVSSDATLRLSNGDAFFDNSSMTVSLGGSTPRVSSSSFSILGGAGRSVGDTLFNVNTQGVTVSLPDAGRVSSSSFSILGGAGRANPTIFSVTKDGNVGINNANPTSALHLQNGDAVFENSSMTVSLGGSAPRVSSSSFSILGGAGRSVGDTLFNVNTQGVTVSLPDAGRVSSSSFSILGGAGRANPTIFSVTKDGNVGINNANPTSALHLQNGDAVFENSSMTVSLGGSTPRVSSSSFSILGGAGRSVGDTLFNVNTQGVTMSLPVGGRVSSSSFSILGGAGRSSDPIFSVDSDATLRLSNGNAFFDNGSVTVSLGGSAPRVSSSSFSILGGAGRSAEYDGQRVANTVFIVKETGRVGIGVDDPLERLDVNGGIHLGYTDGNFPGTLRWNAIGGRFEGFTGANWVTLGSANNGSSVAWNQITGIPTDIADGDNVGLTVEVDPKIGTLSPNALARWNGTRLVNSSIVDSLGKIGIGTAAPTAMLEVNGTFKSAGIEELSDRRLKTGITPLTNALARVMELQGVTFDWRQDLPERNFPTETQMGLIAQEVEKVAPEVVNTDVNGYKSVNYGHLVGLLIEAIKEQQQQMDQLRAENSQLKLDQRDYKRHFERITAQNTRLEANQQALWQMLQTLQTKLAAPTTTEPYFIPSESK